MISDSPAAGPRSLFARFRKLILEHGGDAALAPETRISTPGVDEVFYIPFEHVETSARIAIVGITPGPTQVSLAFEEARRQILLGLNDAEVMRGAKAIGGFGGPSMRPNLVRMLDALKIPALVGAARADDFWAAGARLLHATSVVPHAALRGGKPFAGSFADVLAALPLRESFEKDFLPTLATVPDALFVALGPTPLAALDYAVAQGLLDPSRVLGALAHPSSGSGSQVDVYLGLRRPEDLKPADPVRGRVGFLLPAAERLRASVAARMNGEPPPPPSKPAAPAAAPLRTARAVQPPRAPPLEAAPEGLHYVVDRGANAGLVLVPHVHEDGKWVVSPTRFEKDYVRLAPGAPLETWFTRGFKLRMSNPARRNLAPSLIAAASIRGRSDR